LIGSTSGPGATVTGKRERKDEKEMKRGTYLRIMRNMIRPKEGEVKGGDK
jgi:hypothetical protein